MLRSLKIACLFSALSLSLFSQFQVKNFYSLTGRKNISVNAVTQDFSGYLLLGTSEGLFRFDGRSAQQIYKELNFLKTEITALYVDSRETIWIGTKKGKVFFIKKNKIDSLLLPHGNEERITSFFESGNILNIGTYGNGLYTLQERKINHCTTDQGLSDNVIYKITGTDKLIWCATDGGITEIKHGQSSNFNIISHKSGLPDNIVRDLNFLDNRLIISMQDSGLCYYEINTKRFSKIPFFSNWSLGAVLNTNQINHDELVIGTEKNGLIHIRKGIIYIYDYPEYILESSINQLFIDREKQIWLCSKKGISQLTEKRYNLINTQDGLKENKVLAVAVDNDNSVWIGTSMGISKITNDDRGKTMIVKIKDLDKYIISCAAKAPDGSIWFGTYGYGVLVIDSKSKKELHFTAEKDNLSNDNISNLYFSNKNTLFISTLGGGLIKAKIDPESKNLFTIEKTFTEEEGLGSNYVYSSLTDKNGVLFVGTDGGGLQVLKSGKFVDLTKQYRKSSNTVFSLCLDHYNNIWAISNADGVLKYDGQSLTSINMSNSLREEQPQQIISAEGTIFAFNSKGIDKINCKNNTITYYDILDGENEPNLNAVVSFANRIYSGTNNGILVFRTDKQASDSIKPLVFIKGLTLNYKPFPMDSINEFKYNQNNFSFSFDANWLKNPNKLLFRYRLHGLEDEWLYVTEGKDINYNNLNPGNYTFMVQVKNEEEVWSDPTGYSFIIHMPIWKRLWFWILVILVGSASVYLFIQFRLKTLQRENLLLERRVKERTTQIEKQAQIITQKNKDITDSISYARKIQHAILPADALIKTHLPQSFVLYMTKDIVSGDFYWFNHFNDFSIIAAVDCTGHGVPGAFMSLIGYNQLNRIVNEEKITDPKDILLHLNNGVLGALHKNESESKDGMDIAICKINHKKNTMEYAGAMRPLWIVHKGAEPELVEIKADKIPIGTKQNDREETIKYTTHEIALKKEDVFYIFTDGYADQFGGERDKKYSTARFKELLKANASNDFAIQEKNIREEHYSWRRDHEQVDDILVIGFTV